MADLNAYTVVDIVALPHCEEGQHEHFGPCPDCDDKGMQDAGNGLYRKCKTCGGTREGGPSLGMRDCDLPRTVYHPGQTVHLTAATGDRMVQEGSLAPAGAVNVDELVIRAAAARMGYKLVKSE